MTLLHDLAGSSGRLRREFWLVHLPVKSFEALDASHESGFRDSHLTQGKYAADGSASWINEAGEVVGVAGYPDATGINHGFVWRNGKLSDLGSLTGDRCSFAYAVNSHEQIVGTSFDVEGGCFYPQPAITAWSAVLWENGSIIDLNSRIPSNSSLHLAIALNINERGEIAGVGIPPGVPLGDLESFMHAFLLVPCAERDEGCGNDAEAAAVTQANAAPVMDSSITSSQGWLTRSGIVAAWRARMMQRYHIRGYSQLAK